MCQIRTQTPKALGSRVSGSIEIEIGRGIVYGEDGDVIDGFDRMELGGTHGCYRAREGRGGGGRDDREAGEEEEEEERERSGLDCRGGGLNAEEESPIYTVACPHTPTVNGASHPSAFKEPLESGGL